MADAMDKWQAILADSNALSDVLSWDSLAARADIIDRIREIMVHLPPPEYRQAGDLHLDQYALCAAGIATILGADSMVDAVAILQLELWMSQAGDPEMRALDAELAATEPGAMPAGSHVCHWPGCTAWVGAHSWGCRPHWSQLPMHLQMSIRIIARSGGTEGTQARVIAPAVQSWIDEQEGRSDA